MCNLLLLFRKKEKEKSYILQREARRLPPKVSIIKVKYKKLGGSLPCLPLKYQCLQWPPVFYTLSRMTRELLRLLTLLTLLNLLTNPLPRTLSTSSRTHAINLLNLLNLLYIYILRTHTHTHTHTHTIHSSRVQTPACEAETEPAISLSYSVYPGQTQSAR